MTAPRKPAAPRRSSARPAAPVAAVAPTPVVPAPVAMPVVKEVAVERLYRRAATVEPIAEAPASFLPRLFFHS